MTVAIEEAKAAYQAHFGHPANWNSRAPGRVNIIGEHTDYNDGFVLPMAIERYTYALGRSRADDRLCVYAKNIDGKAETSMATLGKNPDAPWMDYVVGVVSQLQALRMPLCGADLMIVGDVPIGCGLSSSASLEMAVLGLFESLGGFNMEGVEASQLCQRVENNFLGINSGIMDQFISRMAVTDHALFIDCRSHQYKPIPIAFEEATFVIANTKVSRGLRTSEYNTRVQECRTAVDIMKKRLSLDHTHLRDFTFNDLRSCKEVMPDNIFRRACHVITENERTTMACKVMEQGDAKKLGCLLNESDKSLRCDYEVTCSELDTMTSIAVKLPGCYGSRMTGAGFGGCIISLVEKDSVEKFSSCLLEEYKQRTGIDGEIIVTSPAEGALCEKISK